MLTSSASQYLHPDYLQPLPTTLDAKKSPLALLAQTCSAIGKDSSPSKPIIPPIEKKDKDKDKEGRKTDTPKSTTSDGRKSQNASLGDRHDGRLSPGSNKDGGSKSSFRTPPPKDIPPLVPISKSADDKKSPSPLDGSKPATSASPPITSSSSLASSSSAGLHSSTTRINLNHGSLSLEVNHNESTSVGKSSLPPSMHPSSASSSKHGDLLSAHGLLPPGYPGLPLGLGHPALTGMDPASVAHHYPGLAAHSALSSLSAHHHKPGMSPYVKYATVKTSAGATTLVPVCSDPYCTHCKLTMSNAQLTPGGACGAGCTQCDHAKPSLPHTSLPFPGLHGLHGLTAAHSALPGLSSSLYPHAFGVLPGHHGLPYICNWVAGSDYCGKRFATSEELLQHLRSHTSSSDATAASATAAAAAAGLAAAGLPYTSLAGLSASALAAAHSHYSSPGSLSPNSALRQPYPGRSMSPNSLLAAARYHPYSKSPLSALPTPTSLSGVHPSLAQYYPYAALYGQRLAGVTP